MNDINLALIKDIRKVVSGYKSDDFTFRTLAANLKLSTDLLKSEFGSEAVLIEKILDYEQHNLESIFESLDFDSMNAIDDLLDASREISKNYPEISPCITFDLRTNFPDVRQKFVERRIQFVDSKIKANFELGMQQGMYRTDLSAELISRLYISRLIDLHNPDYFSNESISFPLLFEILFDTFILGICTDKGRSYYQQKIKSLGFII
jgi:hypothetical protein